MPKKEKPFRLTKRERQLVRIIGQGFIETFGADLQKLSTRQRDMAVTFDELLDVERKRITVALDKAGVGADFYYGRPRSKWEALRAFWRLPWTW